jgi:hypothetical protein
MNDLFYKYHYNYRVLTESEKEQIIDYLAENYYNVRRNELPDLHQTALDGTILLESLEEYTKVSNRLRNKETLKRRLRSSMDTEQYHRNTFYRPSAPRITTSQDLGIEDYTSPEEDPECSVCYKGIKQGEGMRITDCKHIFHRDCLKEWLKRDNTCPNCRADVTSWSTFFGKKKNIFASDLKYLNTL